MGLFLLLTTLLMSPTDPTPLPGPPSDLPAHPAVNSSTWSTIPFELNANFLIIVHVRVANLPNLRFIVDTGSSYTVIDPQIADQLNLPRQPKQITNFDRQITVESTQLPNLAVGTLQTGPLTAVVAKLTDYSDYAQNIDGILGLDVLTKTSRLFINYERHTIAWQTPGNYSVSKNPNSVSADTTNSERPTFTYLAVPITIQGSRFHLVLDTGLQGLILYKDRLQKSLPNIRIQGPPIEMHLGHTQATQIQLPNTEIAGPESTATALLINSPTSTPPPNIDGYLGVTTLHPKLLELNFTSHTLLWQ
jgi:predicted aspartyl protease